MGSDDLRGAIRKLGTQIASQLTPREVFLSAEFYDYARNLASFILRKRKLYNLAVQFNEDPNATIAYTDGKNIVLNAGNVLAMSRKRLEQKFSVNMGIIFHEVAHKLFIDFDVFHEGMESIADGKLYGNFVVQPGTELETRKQELEKALDDGYRRYLASVYAEVLNIICDGHDEAAMKRCFPGFIRKSIEAAGKAQIEQTPSLNEVVANGGNELSIFYSLMLQYAKFGFCKVDEDTPEVQPYLERFAPMEPIVEACMEEGDYKDRWDHINMLILHLWPTLKVLIDQNDPNNSSPQSSQQNSQQGSGSSGSVSGSASGSRTGGSNGGVFGPMIDEQLQQLAQEAANAAAAAANAAPAPSGEGKAVSESIVKAGAGDPGGSETDVSSIVNDVASNKAKSEVQKQIDQEQLDAIRNTNTPLVHKEAKVHVCRHFEEDRDTYNDIYREVSVYVRNLISEMRAFLEETNTPSVQHHRRFGPIVEAKEAYRVDNAFFAKKHLPDDRPNMAMCVLLDESGSMCGPKIQMAKKALVMLERFASGVGVPLMVAGHYANGGHVVLNIYTDFVSANPEKDRYALAAIDDHGCNRDGLPLRICAEMLAQRSEDIRLMVVISDGAPNDTGYHGQAANKDICDTVAEFRRKGLTIYGAAIDDDREVIQELYGKGFLSITDLKSLPKTMVRLLRQNL